MQAGIDKEVKLTFNTITARKTTGSVITIDVQEELKRDQSSSIGEIINGKVPGIIWQLQYLGNRKCGYVG